jgi:tRNA A58 N-methylase Trm61
VFNQIILLVVLLFLVGLGLGYLLLMLYYRLTRKEVFVPFVPADIDGVRAMCDAVGLTGKEKVVDLGSGWGTMVFYLARTFPELQVTGVELNAVLHFLARLRKLFWFRNYHITLLRNDAKKIPLETYDVVFLFMLSPFVNRVLVPKFEQELRKGAVVVSYVFPMKSSKFEEKKLMIPSHGWRSAIYVYRKK